MEDHAPSARWRVDTLVSMLGIAGSECDRSVPSAVVVYVSQNEGLHAHAAHKTFRMLQVRTGFLELQPGRMVRNHVLNRRGISSKAYQTTPRHIFVCLGGAGGWGEGGGHWSVYYLQGEKYGMLEKQAITPGEMINDIHTPRENVSMIDGLWC